ncbi:Calmodulin-like protein 4 [Chionoecetes opilio]|uniref:Calmodulin-like protein 4 n=1 Tax=Chionoecetes opilio TaxID=41210 RepID=A0A8J4YVV6_CHIOP|nr:Calmodulin-like protein 4 [Chionoecetes opilio]
MARHFKEQDIDEFRECFSLYARNGTIRTLDQLTVIMRSLGLSPTIAELKPTSGTRVSKAHSSNPQEILAPSVTPHTAQPKDLRHILLHWGERLSHKEVEQIFREANISPNGNVRYQDFCRIVCAPVPDYY